MNKLALFTDISIDTKLKMGWGAYLVIPELHFNGVSNELIKKMIKVRKFESTSSTKAEVETLLWALEELEKNHKGIELYSNLTIYTDSQCIAGLLGRRHRLEATKFKSLKTNKELNNALLYSRFYYYSDKLKFKVIKLKGHLKSTKKDKLHRIFSNVDKVCRKALRIYLDNDKSRYKTGKQVESVS